MLQWTQGYVYLFKLEFSFSLDKHTELELLDHIAVLFLIFWGTSILFSIGAAAIYIPTKGVQGSLFSTSLLILVIFVWDSGPVSFFCMWLCNFLKTIYWRYYPFHNVDSCLLCNKLIEHICMDLFLGFKFYSIGLCICFCANTILFWLLRLCSIVWNQGAW